MTGNFNIAVAEFVQTELDGEAASSQVAKAVSQRIFSFLDGEYVTSSLDNVQVAHYKIGIIHDGSEAEALAAAINADLVIYGDVTVDEPRVLVSPKFYMSNTYRSGTGEVNGEYRLAAPVNFDTTNVLDPSDKAMNEMRQRAGILIEFTRSLVYLGTGDLAPAARTINLTLQTAENETFEGKEVLYLFASHIARLQGNNVDAQRFIDTALELNGNYGRALIAQANIYYDQSQLDQARIVFEKALTLEYQPDGSFVAEKANLGLGNVYTVQYQEINRNPEATPTEAIRFANQALSYYQAVVDSYLGEPENNLLVDLGILAYYGSGIIYHTAGNCETARTVLEQARGRLGETSLIISNVTTLRNEIDRRLEELTSCD
jgi:tetratricopeptide (TPR) repeat protein